MRLSTKVRYGSRALVELYMIQKDSSPVINSVLAKNQNLSLKYLESLMGAMKKAGLISSTRGCKGGYRLTRPASEITLLDIFTALEGPMQLTPCMSKEKGCASTENCPTQSTWTKITHSFKDVMAKVTLEEMSENYIGGTYGS